MTLLNKNEKNIAQRLQSAFKNGNDKAVTEAFEELRNDIEANVMANVNQGNKKPGYMSKTTEDYYNQIADRLKAKQITKPGDVPMPTTEVDKVMDNMQTTSKILDGINVVSNTYLTKVVTNGNAVTKGTWGDLTEAIVKEMLAAFKVVELEESKVSCFGQVSTDMLEAGPQFLQGHMNNTLTESLVTAIEEAVISGTGNKMPIGLDRDLSGSVVDGVYPQKKAIVVKDFGVSTYADLVKQISKDENGRPKKFDKVQLIVNNDTFLTKIMPATTMINPLTNIGYQTNVFAYPTEVIVSEAVADNEAIMCLLGEYVAAIGKQIEVSYSDDYKFIEDLRTFKGKAFMTGKPVDNTSAIRLDISGLEPLVPMVKTKQA